VTRPNDVGGSDGFGPVDDRTDDVVFHEPWERQVFGLMMGFSATGRAGDATIRDAVDRMAPGHYLSATYWERWLTGLATIRVDQGITTAEELAERAGGPFPLGSPPAPPAALLALVDPEDAEPGPRFERGDEVRVRAWHPAGHTRCPRYAQGRTGTVVRRNARHALPDLEVATGAIRSEHTYCVRFEAADLWGEGASAHEVV